MTAIMHFKDPRDPLIGVLMVKASLVWLNYNSMRFMDIALKSIDSVLNLDLDGFEVIIVDNASTDGSFETIKRYVEGARPNGVRVKFIRNDRNLGYAGGMNVGWSARDPDARFVAFLNNDLVVEPQSLRKIVEHMEGDEKAAAASGLIYHGDGKTIYSAGGWIDEVLTFGGICNGFSVNTCPGINKEHYVTYADGAYMVVRAEAVKKATPNGKPFIDETFLYLDDNLLGLILWNKGYELKYVLVNAGIHFVGMTTKGSIGAYYGLRASTTLWYIVETIYSPFRRLWLLRRRLYYFINRALYKGFEDGSRLGKMLLEELLSPQ
mgnify:CR=1 FL=1